MTNLHSENSLTSDNVRRRGSTAPNSSTSENVTPNLGSEVDSAVDTLKSK